MSADRKGSLRGSALRSGDLVEVRDREEILATLDPNGCLDGLPFMPEMLQFCGRRFRVSTRSHKCCDTIHKTGNRRMKDAVNLEDLRCDGSAHEGCQAWCLLIWKGAWLRRVDAHEPARPEGTVTPCEALEKTCTLPPEREGGAIRYRCQTTELFRATTPLKWWDIRHYLEDLRSRNVRLGDMFGVFALRWIYLLLRFGRGHRFLLRLYNGFAARRGSPPYPYENGGPKERTPRAELGIQSGDVVRVRSNEEIRETLAGWKNRGMVFDPEMVVHCGRKFRVRQRVERIINENTGEMIHIKGDCIMLDGTTCRAEHSDRRLFCSRAIPSYWREIWLERCEDGEEPDPLP